MYKLVMLLIIGGAMLAWHGYQEYELGQRMSPEAKVLTYGELASTGPGDNAHVKLTGHLLCPNGFVYQRRDAHGPWSTVYIPAVSANGRFADDLRQAILLYGTRAIDNLPRPSGVRVIVKSAHVQNADQLDALASKASIEGVVVNTVESLGSKETALMAKMYPGTDLSKCWILEEGRQPTSPVAAMGFMGGGALMFIGGFVVVAKH